jgi:hypothetical protein
MNRLSLSAKGDCLLPDACKKLLDWHLSLYRLISCEVEFTASILLCRRMSTGNSSGRRFYCLNNGVSEVRSAGRPTYVTGEFAAVAVDLVDRITDFQCRIVLAEMAQHQQSGSQHGGRIRDIFSGNVRRGTMDSFEDGALVTEIRAGDET